MLDIDLLLESEGLFQTIFPTGDMFVYRLLTLKEYRIFRSLRDSGVLPPEALAEKVFERCYAGDASWIPGDIPAGVGVSIGNLIMYLSGDCEADTIKNDLAQARKFYDSDGLNEHMKRVICTAFPALLWDDIDNWSRVKLIKQFTISDSILEKRIPEYKVLDPKHIKNPKEVAASKAPGPIDMARENAMIRKATGPWAEEDNKKHRQLSSEQIELLKRKKQQMQRG